MGSAGYVLSQMTLDHHLEHNSIQPLKPLDIDARGAGTGRNSHETLEQGEHSHRTQHTFGIERDTFNVLTSFTHLLPSRCH